MDTNKSSGFKLIPEALPGERPLGHFLDDSAFRQTIIEIEEPQRRMMLWTAALQTWVLDRELQKAPGFRFASIGFADPETEVDAFGVLVYFNALTDESPKNFIEVAGQKFVLIVRPSYEELHGWPQVHPLRGTATCWAEPRKPSVRTRTSFLTAKHVLEGGHVGETVETTAGKGKIVGLGPDSIDAALVAPPDAAVKKLGKPLPCVPYIAQLSDVQFEGIGSRRPVKTKVTEVWFRDANDPSLPGRIFLAMPGTPGDSGALVRDIVGNGIGIYLGGQVNVATQRMEGFCQHLGQAAGILDCDLFQ
jgi:hypothetical protein